jgi:hypothetical protein
MEILAQKWSCGAEHEAAFGGQESAVINQSSQFHKTRLDRIAGSIDYSGPKTSASGESLAARLRCALGEAAVPA